ncbi:MAG: YceI family protein [Phycisphaerae bacterium]
MKKQTAFFPALGVLFLVGATQAAEFEYNIDTVHSSVTFKVMRQEMNYAHGRFNKFSGKMILDDRNEPKNIKIDCAVEMKSVDTANKGRDKHLRKNDFFNVKKFSEARFTTSKSKKIGDNKFELKGDMTFMGTTVPMTVEFVVGGTRKTDNGYVLGGETTFDLNVTDFGMPSHPGLADSVSVTVSIFGVYKLPPVG